MWCRLHNSNELTWKLKVGGFLFATICRGNHQVAEINSPPSRKNQDSKQLAHWDCTHCWWLPVLSSVKSFQTIVGRDFPAMIQWSWCLWANTGFPAQNDRRNHSYVWALGLHNTADSVSLNNIMLGSHCVWHYQLPILNILFKVEQLVDDLIICLIMLKVVLATFITAQYKWAKLPYYC